MYEDVKVRTIQEAVSALQDRVNKLNNEGYIESWCLCIDNVDRRDNNSNNNNNNDGEQNDSLWWNRFLTMLSQESSNTRLEGFIFSQGVWDRRDDELLQLERFFRDVLPNLASMTEINFFGCHILPAYMDMFLTSLINNNNDNNNSSNLRILHFVGTKLHSSTVAAIARLLRSDNGNKPPPIDYLCLYECSIDSTKCELLLQALHGNSCLTILHLSHNEISEISLEAAKALGNCKALHYLDLEQNPLSDQSLCHLAHGLRTTRSLGALMVDWVNARGGLALNAFAKLLQNFNYSLCVVSGIEKFQGMEELLHQNEKIRRLPFILGEEGITTTSNYYCLPQLYLWPLTMECIGNKPSLIYHFLRHGNLESFMDQVLLAAGSYNNVLSKSVRESKEAES